MKKMYGFLVFMALLVAAPVHASNPFPGFPWDNLGVCPTRVQCVNVRPQECPDCNCPTPICPDTTSTVVEVEADNEVCYQVYDFDVPVYGREIYEYEHTLPVTMETDGSIEYAQDGYQQLFSSLKHWCSASRLQTDEYVYGDESCHYVVKATQVDDIWRDSYPTDDDVLGQVWLKSVEDKHCGR